MRYGFCTGFTAAMDGTAFYPLLEEVLRSGYDYVEFPLMQTAVLPQSAFDALVRWLADAHLAADATCSMFPGSLRLTGPEVDFGRLSAYLDLAFARLAQLGTRKIVLGSSAARDLPAGVDSAAGYGQLEDLIGRLILPRLEQYDCLLAIEPIAKAEANFITTLPEGMELVRRMAHPRVRLLADTIHMLREGESPSVLGAHLPALCHIHISELERVLPTGGYTPALAALLEALSGRYDGTVSFETAPCAQHEGVERALHTLRATLEAQV